MPMYYWGVTNKDSPYSGWHAIVTASNEDNARSIAFDRFSADHSEQAAYHLDFEPAEIVEGDGAVILRQSADMALAYQMVRKHNHVLIDRQRTLQAEQIALAKQIDGLRAGVAKLGEAITVVEQAGGEANSLRAQIETARVELRRIEPRLSYLDQITTLLAANLRLIDQAHEALHWLRFEEVKLDDFDKRPEVLISSLAA